MNAFDWRSNAKRAEDLRAAVAQAREKHDRYKWRPCGNCKSQKVCARLEAAGKVGCVRFLAGLMLDGKE